VYESSTHWIWDFWLIEHSGVWHCFHLQAPRSVHPDDRHWHASIGHATSADLVEWERQRDALHAGEPGSPDETSTWTGSVAADPDGGWLMAYTGIVRPADGVATESVLFARSDDLLVWHKVDGARLESDPVRYERPGTTAWHHGWRDPWIRHAGDGWEMLLSARLASEDPWTAGAIVRATSPDGDRWTVDGPVPGTSGMFAQLEVPHVVEVEGRRFLIMCTNTDGSWPRHDPAGRHLVGTFAAPFYSDGSVGAFEALDAAERPTRYAGRVIETDDGPRYLAFVDGAGLDFKGGVTDAVRVGRTANGGLHLAGPVDL
jgi:beta-fructofuranosidase